MSQSPLPLPLRANLDWLKKTAKDRLEVLRAAQPDAQLADAQLAVAREFGFPSWRALHEQVERMRSALDALVSPEDRAADASQIAPDDPELLELIAAVRAGELEPVTRILRRRPVLARAKDATGQTSLHVAAEHDDARIGVFLLSCGADPNATFGDSGHNALSWAVTCNAMEFARTMVRVGVKPDLFCAAGIGSLEHVQSYFDESSGLLRPRASITGSSRYGADGARLPCPPTNDVELISDALYAASRNGHEAIVRFLLTKNRDLSFRAYSGGTALHWAYFGGSRAVIDLLIAAGADQSARDDVLKCTPRAFGICTPASWGFVFLVRKRLDEDPTLLNFTDGQTTALHEAARAGHAGVVKLLLERGVDRSIRDANGKTALDVAHENDRVAVVALLS